MSRSRRSPVERSTTVSGHAAVAASGQDDFRRIGSVVAAARAQLGVGDPNPATPERCVNDAEWKSARQTQLNNHSLTNWTIVSETLPGNEPCFSVREIDTATRAITLLQSRS